jgi:hypothetical protein
MPFSVQVGTIFEDSHIPLAKWIAAFHMICASKKGVSALQLQRSLGLGSYRSAWHMAHRIRHAMRSEPLRKLLGVVEADETYIGGKPRKLNPKNRGQYRKSKTPVVALGSWCTLSIPGPGARDGHGGCPGWHSLPL